MLISYRTTDKREVIEDGINYLEMNQGIQPKKIYWIDYNNKEQFISEDDLELFLVHVEKNSFIPMVNKTYEQDKRKVFVEALNDLKNKR